MLEHHEEEALAAIEAQLRAEDPDLAASLDAGVARRHVHPVLRSLIVLVVAVGVTAGTTVWLGAELGGLVAVLGLSYAFLYAWQALRVCRGTRQQR